MGYPGGAPAEAEPATKRLRPGDPTVEVELATELVAEVATGKDDVATASAVTSGAVPSSSSEEADRPWPSEFSLAELEAEVAAFRSHPPPYVSDIGELRVPTLICDEEGVARAPLPGEGPWDLQLCVAGPEGDEAYGYPVRIRLRFDADLWPKHMAVVRFLGVFHHGLTDDAGGMTMPFYKALPRSPKGVRTILIMVEAVRKFLADPWSVWEPLPSEAVRVRPDASIKAHRELNRQRLQTIRSYGPLRRHPALFAQPPRWEESWLDPAFWRASSEGSAEAWRSILEEHLPGQVFSFKLFTDAFCDLLVEELFSFYDSGLPARRPNSMNNYGIILNDIGLEPLIEELQRLLQPLGELLFPGPGSAWDGQHCFLVRYRHGEDLGLDMHTDDSDVTFNVCLGLEFEGAGLQFCGVMGAPDHRKHSMTYKHAKGRCVTHLGRLRHGADDISSGERLNLILWNHSGDFRNSDSFLKVPYQTEEGPPDPICVSYTHDRDYGSFKAFTPKTEKFRGGGWCPRPTFEYEGFQPDEPGERAVCCRCGRRCEVEHT